MAARAGRGAAPRRLDDLRCAPVTCALHVATATGRTASEPRPAAVIPACLFAWLIPGGGHFYLRRGGKGTVFLCAILALFFLGAAMDARLTVYFGWDEIFETLRTCAQFFVGTPCFLARALGYGLERGLVKSINNEYGTTFTQVAGLLNILVILDARDTALGRKQ